MNPRLVLATNNGHKLKELRLCLPGITIMGPRDLGINFHHDETETTFLGNSLGKARSLRLCLDQLPDGADLIAVADDSGISARALSGRPGVWSARYGADRGLDLDDRGRAELLLADMADQEDRHVWYTCVLSALWPGDRFVTVQETWEGSLARDYHGGTTGFGYDPVVIIPIFGLPVSRISEEQKAISSHRAKAARRLWQAIQ